jgi:response regulator RpfG family c-di-GMP phosphodiesterase
LQRFFGKMIYRSARLIEIIDQGLAMLAKHSILKININSCGSKYLFELREMLMALDQDEDWMLEDDDEELSTAGALVRQPWKLLIVDDEPDVHRATILALKNIVFKGRGLEILHAYSGREGFEKIAAHTDIALAILDVVMETDDAGLRLVKRIRDELGNQLVRIVLRTGQPGHAPEQQVVLEYDINDYKTKTELVANKIFTTVIASLRSFESLHALEKSSQGLAKILEGATNLYQLHSLKEFASGVLKQVGAILNLGEYGMLCAQSKNDQQNFEVLAATGPFTPLLDGETLPAESRLLIALNTALKSKCSQSDYPYEVLYIAGRNSYDFVVHFSPPWPLEIVDRNLLDIFCERISAAMDNLYLYQQLRRSQEATVMALADLGEFRDQTTGDHVLRVQKLTDAIAGRLKAKNAFPELMDNAFMEMVGMASILHDVGKVGTPDHILFKPGKLTPEEREIMNQHSPMGAAILARTVALVEGTTYLSLGAEIAGGHHEHFDGNGYPLGIKGDEIPLSARIVALVDVFDALLHKRPYKEPWTMDETMAYVRERSGTQFDPQIVAALDEVVAEGLLSLDLLQDPSGLPD